MCALLSYVIGNSRNSIGKLLMLVVRVGKVSVCSMFEDCFPWDTVIVLGDLLLATSGTERASDGLCVDPYYSGTRSTSRSNCIP